ncbi:MAG: hypothetical protein HW421_3948 [Ignavibacteria bacterium]|nr:hypothetical protein [Ignavibacteria bacterium]
MILNNKKELYERRKILRKNMTEEEIILWSVIKKSALKNYKFRRQHSVGFYILDFYCPVKKLAIELDGGGHFQEGALEYDKNRDEFLTATGITVLRFTNTDIRNNLNGVLQRIEEVLDKLKSYGNHHIES